MTSLKTLSFNIIAIHKLREIWLCKKLLAIGFPHKHALLTLQDGVENRDKAY